MEISNRAKTARPVVRRLATLFSIMHGQQAQSRGEAAQAGSAIRAAPAPPRARFCAVMNGKQQQQSARGRATRIGSPQALSTDTPCARLQDRSARSARVHAARHLHHAVHSAVPPVRRRRSRSRAVPCCAAISTCSCCAVVSCPCIWSHPHRTDRQCWSESPAVS